MSFRTRTHPADKPVDILPTSCPDKPSMQSSRVWRVQAISRRRTRPYEHTKALTDAACFMQMVYGVEQQQAVAELQPGGQDVHQKRDATDDPAPAAVGIEVLSGIRREEEEV